MDQYHQYSRLAVEQLLEICPELRPAWDDNESLLTDDEGEVMFYSVFGQIILPFLQYALSTVPRSVLEESRFDYYTEEMFRQNENWRDVPNSKSPDFDDLLRRLYEVFELWAVSPDKHVREAVCIELLESGYVNVSVVDLSKRGGPNLASLREWIENNSLGGSS
jgi:hypothetical protein